MGQREQGRCQRWDQKNWSGREAGATSKKTGGAFHPFLFALDLGGLVL